VKRREFIRLLGGAAAAWPLGAIAQRPEKMRRIGVLMPLGADDAEGQARLAAFLDALQQLGWTDGRNLRIDTRWGAGDVDRYRRSRSSMVICGSWCLRCRPIHPAAVWDRAGRVAPCNRRPAARRSPRRQVAPWQCGSAGRGSLRRRQAVPRTIGSLQFGTTVIAGR